MGFLSGLSKVGKVLGVAGKAAKVGQSLGLLGGKSDGIDVSENVKLAGKLFDSKIASAKKHNLHPLFALGAQTGYSPIVGQSSTGGQVGDALMGLGDELAGHDVPRGTIPKQVLQQNAENINRTRAEIRLLEAQADAIRQQLQASTIARAAQSLSSTPTGQRLESALGDVNVNLSHNPQQEWEDRYGGMVAEPIGLFNFLNAVGSDLGKHLYYNHQEYLRQGTHDPYVEGP